MDLARFFDHTNLNPSASSEDIEKLCREALDYGFYSVCLHPAYIPLARQILEASPVKIATVVGFPQGQNTKETKVFETRDALEKGAQEIDMVMNFAALKDKRFAEVLEELVAVKEACQDRVLKVILETSQLSEEEIVRACNICDKAGVDFVKTSTGFLGAGASRDIVSLMKRNSKAQIKASGGIRSLKDARTMIAAGASRLGSSSGVAIMEELKDEGL